MSEVQRLQQRIFDLEADLRRYRGDIIAARVRVQTLTEQLIQATAEAARMRNAWEVERKESARAREPWGLEEG